MGTKRFKVQKRVSVQTANCSKGFKRFQTMNKGRLVPIEVHYMEKNPGMFSSKTLISF